MSNWAPINAKQTPTDGDSNDASSSELPIGQAVSTDALNSGYSTTMNTDGPSSPTPHPYYSRASLLPCPNAPNQRQPSYGDRDDKRANVPSRFPTWANPGYENRQSGPPASNTDNLASPSVPAVLTQDSMHQSLHGPGSRPADRENTRTHQNSAANRPRNGLPSINLSADRVSEAYEVNTRHLVRLLSPQADDLVHRLVNEHRTPMRRSNVSAVSIINEHAWKLILETAMEELKVPICRLSTIGRALKDVYTESERTDEAKRSNPIFCCIKDLSNRIEQTLHLFDDIPHFELALAGLRLKQHGLGSADPNRAHPQSREGPTYPGPSSTQLGPDLPPPGRGLQRVDCEAEEGKL